MPSSELWNCAVIRKIILFCRKSDEIVQRLLREYQFGLEPENLCDVNSLAGKLKFVTTLALHILRLLHFPLFFRIALYGTPKRQAVDSTWYMF